VTVSLASQPAAQNTIGSGTDTLSGIENLIGSNFADRLTGDANNNRLTGGLASDTLTGGAVNDTYVVNITSAGALEDTVVEAAGAGTDTLIVQGTYATNRARAITATANVEVIDISATGSSRLGITASSTVTDTTFIGNAAANTLTGSNGNDTFTGGAGADILNGGGGTNIYNVNLTNAGALEDQVTGGTGLDTIVVKGASGNANATTLTAGSTIERYDISGTFSSKLNLTGNTLSNYLTGNDADNVINGGSGVDTMVGGLGNDTYVVDNIGDVITENADQGTADLVNSGITFSLLAKGINIERLTLTGTTAINGTGNNGDNLLTGNTAINTLIGNDGNDILIGKAGNDVLTGGVGADTFWFDTATNATTNRDTITDFASGVDKLQFSQSVMTALGSTGQFTANDQRFWSSNTGVAHDTSDRLIFNTSTGVLSYDSDGTGRNAAVAVELIGGNAPIATDIFVV
jgi:Ca2+-binding RTX toxin-like protein